MEIEITGINNSRIAEVVSEKIIIASTDEGVNLLGNLYYQQVDKVILHERNLTPAFFDLKTGMAGEILQKFSNYRIRLAIVGDFSAYQSKSMKDFIFESNRFGHIIFAGSRTEAIERLLKHG